MTDKQRRSPYASGSTDVQRMVEEAQQKQAASKRGDGRGRAGNAGQKGVDKTGASKMTLWLPLDAQSSIRAAAEKENLSQGDIVAFAMRLYDELDQAGKIDLFDYKELVHSETQPWRSSTKLILPDDFRFFGD